MDSDGDWARRLCVQLGHLGRCAWLGSWERWPLADLWQGRLGWAGVNKFTLTSVTNGGSIDLSNSNSNDGPVGGVGIEWAFAPNWTAKLEYDNLFLSDKNFTVQTGFPVLGGRTFSTVNRDVQTVTVGVNYLFNWH